MSRKRKSRPGSRSIWENCSGWRWRKHRSKNCSRSWSTPSRASWFPYRNWSKDEEGIDAATVFGSVLLHAAEPRRRRHDGEAVPAEQDCRGALLQPGPGSDFRGNGVRAGEKGLAGTDDPQHRGAIGEGRAAARRFHAAHGEVRFADKGQGRHEPL